MTQTVFVWTDRGRAFKEQFQLGHADCFNFATATLKSKLNYCFLMIFELSSLDPS